MPVCLTPGMRCLFYDLAFPGRVNTVMTKGRESNTGYQESMSRERHSYLGLRLSNVAVKAVLAL